MATNFEVRLLLVLWDLGGLNVRKGDLNGRFSGKAKEANEACRKLLQAGAIEAIDGGKSLTLTDAGKAMLIAGLADETFEFEGSIIGAKMGNALLKWMRSMPTVSPAETSGTSNGKAIESYEAFQVMALETFDRLNRDFNMDNLVPIYRIRREIGDRVERTQFNEWLLEMQAGEMFQLIGGEMPELTPAIAEDSIKTALGSVRYYAKKI